MITLHRRIARSLEDAHEDIQSQQGARRWDQLSSDEQGPHDMKEGIRASPSQKDGSSTPPHGSKRFSSGPDSTQETAPASRKRVLIVDDSLSVRMALRATLSQAGYSVTACDSLSSARAALSALSFSIIILDLLLPDGSGIDFAAELRAIPSTARVPMIMISGASDVWARIRGLRAGVDECLQKPWDDAHLLGRVGELILSKSAAHPSERGVSERGRVTPVPSAAEPTSGRRVLVVEDNITYWRRLSASLSVRGYITIHAPTAEEGLELLMEDRFDAVLICAQVPSMGGVRMCKRVRMGWGGRDTPILITTSPGTFAETREAGLRAGASQVIVKHPDVETVVASILEMIQKRSAFSKSPI